MTKACWMALAICFAGAVFSDAAGAQPRHVWNGEGVADGTYGVPAATDNRWHVAGNWLIATGAGDAVTYRPASAAPGTGDDVNVTFNTTRSADELGQPLHEVALLLTHAASARHVEIRGVEHIDGSFTAIGAEPGTTATFETFHVLSSSNRKINFNAAIFVLTGGSEDRPTLRHVQTNSLGFAGDPMFRFPGQRVDLDVRGQAAGHYRFEHDEAVIHGGGRPLRTVSVGLHPGQRFADLPVIHVRQEIINLGGGEAKLDNLGTVGIVAGVGALALPAGTYGHLHVDRNSGASGPVRVTLGADVTLAGAAEMTIQDREQPVALLVSRQGRSSGPPRSHEARLTLAGHTLKIVGSGDAVVGVPGYTQQDTMVNTAVLDLTGSTLHVAGSLIVGESGMLVGDDRSVVTIGRDFQVAAAAGDNGSLFNLSASTVVMVPPRTSPPQNLEVQGKDLGHGPAGMQGNLALGKLQIGTAEQRAAVRLASSGDGHRGALYVGELHVHAGSVLDLAGLPLYVAGQRVEPGRDTHGPGRIVSN